MKKIFHLALAILLSISQAGFATTGKTSLTGKITDKNTGEILTGVTIYAPDLKIGTITGPDGTYKLENLPQTKILLQVSFIGYRTIVQSLDLSVMTKMDFTMETSVTEMNEVVVTGMSQSTERNRTPAPITIVPKITLLQNSSTNIIDAIARQPGVAHPHLV